MAAQPDTTRTTTHAQPDRDEREYSTQSPPDRPPPTDDGQSRRIAEVSPEGIPADPRTNRRTLNRIIVGFVIVVLVVALLLAVFLNRWAGLGVGALAIGVLLFNPTMWAAILRVKEREQ
ncbi:MAG: hypothetical protein ACIAQU_13500 [Phycisphaerales bacterium JB064]